MVCTEPLPNERVPMTVARLWSCRAPATISDAEAEPPLISTITGLFLVRSPARALKRCVSSALRPRVETISPFSRNASDTEIAWSSRPPGLLRRSRTKPLSLSAGICVARSLIAFFRFSVVCSLNWLTRM